MLEVSKRPQGGGVASLILPSNRNKRSSKAASQTSWRPPAPRNRIHFEKKRLDFIFSLQKVKFFFNSLKKVFHILFCLPEAVMLGSRSY